MSTLAPVPAGPPNEWDANTLSAAIHARAISCRELMQACLAQVDRLNPRFNAIVSRVDADLLLHQGDDCDRELGQGSSRGWMHGFPLAVKDLSAVAGIPLTKGSVLLRDNRPTQDDLMVQRLKRAGAIVIGKTNTPEFGLGSQTYNRVFGTTRNAYDPTRCAGGSSGGAAVALALRMLPVADGSDMMGSLRNPAAFNNVFGLRPSMGRVPDGPAPEAWLAQLGTAGPMARTVEDLARLLAVQAGRDDRVPLSIAGTWPHDPPDLSLDLRTTRIGWLGDLQGYLPIEDGILALCESALTRIAADGCRIEAVAPRFDPPQAWQTWLTWRRWLDSHGLQKRQPRSWLSFNYAYQMTQAALAGQGLVLARPPLVAENLARGDLVEVLPGMALRSPMAYWLLVSPRSAARPEVQAFADWLAAQAVATRSVVGEGDDPDLVNDLD